MAALGVAMKRMRRWATAQHGPVQEAGITLGVVAVAFGLRYELEGALPPGFPYLTFFPAVILTSFFAGTRAGVGAAVLCGLASWYFFINPVGSWALNGASLLALLFYCFIVATDIVLIHLMREALRKLDAEKQTSDALAVQNKLMFHELQHRVSNNLQVVASLLKMQRRQLEDEAARAALDTASARLQVMAGIQRQLHNPKRQEADIAALLGGLLPEVIGGFALEPAPELRVSGEGLKVGADQATPIGLIVVELVSNALEHAARPGAALAVAVTVAREGNVARISVRDNGPGLAPDFQPERSRSLGLRVALQFTEQLGGRLEFASDRGTVATLSFPLAEG